MAEEIGTAYWTIAARMDQLERDMAKAEQTVARGVEGGAKKAEDALGDVERRVTQFSMAATAAFAGIGIISGKSAIDFESSFAGIRKTVDATEDQFAELATGMRNMALEIPVNVNELNRIGEAAGQLGIETQNIMAFTRVMADLGVATNLSSDQAATSLARLANITQMPQTEFDRLGSTVVALGNNFATTESEIVEMGLRLAGAGSQVGLTEAQILGLAAALSSVGINAEAGGSAISRVMIEIASQVETSGDKLEGFAAVAGMSAQEFSTAWRQDAAGALVAFVTGLGQMEAQGGSTLQTLEDLEITEFRMRDALLRAAGAGDLLNDSLRTGTDAWEENTALTREAEQRYSTTASKIQLFRNNINDAAISLGQQFLPALGAGVDGANKLITAFAGLPPEVQRNIFVFGTLAAATPALISGIGKVAGALDGVGKLLDTTRGKFMLFGTGAVAGLAVLDAIVGTTTGEGLFSRIASGMRDVDEAADGAARGIRSFDLAMRSAGEAADPLAIGLSNIDQQMRMLDAITQGTDARFQGFQSRLSGNEFERLAGEIAGAITAMSNAGVSATELLDKYESLPPSVQEIVASQIDLEGIMADARGEMNDSITATRGWQESMAAAELEAAGLADAAREMAVSIAASETEINAFSLADFYATLDDEEVEDFVEEVQEDFDNLIDSIASLFPATEEEFGKWREAMQKMTEDHQSFKSNLTTIYDALKAAGVEMPEEIVAALAEKGPGYAANFAKWFAEDPQAALDALALTGPIAAGEFTDGVIQEVLGLAPGTDVAMGLFEQSVLEGIELARVNGLSALDGVSGEYLAAVKNGLINSPERAAMIAEFRALGLNAGAAFSLALNGSMADAQMAAAELANAGYSGAADELEISSPSRRFIYLGEMAGEGFAIGIGNSIVHGIEAVSAFIGEMRNAAAIEAPTIAEAFSAAASDSAFRQELIDTYGELGADAAGALIDALATKDARYTDALVRAVNDMVARAEKAGVKNARQLGQQIIDALLSALEGGDPLLVDVALGLIGSFDATIEAHAKEPAVTMIEGFWSGFNEAKASRQLEEKLGREGARFVENLIEGWESKDPDLLASVGGSMDGLIQEMTEGMAPSKAAAITAAFTDAVLQYIETGGAEWLAKLKDILAEIEAVGKGAEAAGGGSGLPSKATQVGYRQVGSSDTYLPIFLGPDGSVIQVGADGRKHILGNYDPNSVGGPTLRDIAHGFTNATPPEGATIGWTGGFPTPSNPTGEQRGAGAHSAGTLLAGWVPNLAIGMPRVPFDNFAALLHRDEAVLTAVQAREWRDGQGGFAPTFNVYPSPGMDEEQLAAKTRDIVRDWWNGEVTTGAARWGVG